MLFKDKYNKVIEESCWAYDEDPKIRSDLPIQKTVGTAKVLLAREKRPASLFDLERILLPISVSPSLTLNLVST